MLKMDGMTIPAPIVPEWKRLRTEQKPTTPVLMQSRSFQATSPPSQPHRQSPILHLGVCGFSGREL